MKPLLAAAAVALALSLPAHAQPVRPVRPLDGYACMKLALTEAQAMDPRGTGINLLAEPSAGAAVITTAPSVVFVRSPHVQRNGYLEAIALNGKPAWIAADKVQPMDPLARCTPSVMSNGRLGVG